MERQEIIGTLPYTIEGFEIVDVVSSNDEIQIDARSTSTSARCPSCGQVSTSIHGWYQRHPQEISSIGRHMRLVFSVKKFRCHQIGCERQTFAESLADWLPRYASRTESLTTLMRQMVWR